MVIFNYIPSILYFSGKLKQTTKIKSIFPEKNLICLQTSLIG